MSETLAAENRETKAARKPSSAFTFRKQKFNVLKEISTKEIIDGTMNLLEIGTVMNEDGSEVYLPVDFKIRRALMLVNIFTDMIIDMDMSNDELYSVYDDLLESGVIPKIEAWHYDAMTLLEDGFWKGFHIMSTQARDNSKKKLYDESIGVYMKTLLVDFLGEGNFKEIIAESTGLMDSVGGFMRRLQEEGAKGKSMPGRAPGAMNLSKRENVPDVPEPVSGDADEGAEGADA